MIVYVNVTGDLFHHGHVSFFKKARVFGESLIVGIHSDKDVELYKRRPIMTLAEREKVIAACRYVDQTILAAPYVTSKQFIAENKISLVVASNAYSDKFLSKFYGDPMEMGILKLVDYEKSISTTKIINRCHHQFL